MAKIIPFPKPRITTIKYPQNGDTFHDMDAYIKSGQVGVPKTLYPVAGNDNRGYN